ncbi:MAG TPA: hypothetical protein ENI87_14540 [bacterium]|nr:hypothetical protein [bacterium]
MTGHRTRNRYRSVSILALLAAGGCGAGGGGTSRSETDTIPPQAGQVFDGASLGVDVDGQSETTTLSANWTGFVDDSGVIAAYEWAIGTSAGATDVQPWTGVGVTATAANTNLSLVPSTTYYCSVRAYDEAGNVSVAASSDGITINGSSGGGGSQGGNGGGGGETMAATVSQFGITWTFAESEQVGQFANGDWWVVGPVEVVAISPPTQVVAGRTINGSMVNPGQNEIENGLHGYDSTLFGPYAGNTYQPSLNVAIGVSPSNPLQLAGGSSLISTISWTDSNPPPSGSFSQLQTAAVLTVLDTAPPTGAFRPPYAGTDKTIRFNESQLDYFALGTIASASGQPDLATTAAKFERVWLDHCSSWSSRYMHPIENMPDYGRDFTSLYGTGALLLQTDVPNAQKRDLLVRLTQIGIDFFGNVQNGGVWSGVGGQCSGRKFPILLAGKVLNDATMLALGTTHPSVYYGPGHPNNDSHFGEDSQTFYVQQTSPGTWNWGYGGYDASHDGMPEWGNSHTQYPSNDNVLWEHDPYRRCCTANAWVGQTLAAHIMGLTSAWAHPAYFDYMDRFMQIEAPGAWTRAWEPWQGAMWDMHRSAY